MVVEERSIPKAGTRSRRAYLDTTTSSPPLSPTLSPSAGEREDRQQRVDFPLALAEVERVGVRGTAVVLTISARDRRAQDGFLPNRYDVVLGMPPTRRRRHSYQPRAFALGSSPRSRFPALKARLILPPHQEQPPQCYVAGRWLALGKRVHLRSDPFPGLLSRLSLPRAAAGSR